jgi:hypothetical protein
MTTLTPERIEEIRETMDTQPPALSELRCLLDVWVAAVAMAETYKSPGEDTAHRRLREALGGGR